MQCRFGRLPFEARIPLGNCNCTTRLRSYTLDRNIVRRSAPGMQTIMSEKYFKTRLRFVAHSDKIFQIPTK